MTRVIQSTCLMLLLVFATAAFAGESASTGAQLNGTVTDPKGALVPNAKLTLRNDATGAQQTAVSNESGEYRFMLVPAGQYTLTVESSGFSRLVDRGVTLNVGQVATLPVMLTVAAANEEITVTSEAELIEAQRTSIATTVDQARIDNLPINGRNYIQFTLTNSQVARDTAPSIGAAPTSGLNIGGQRARANLVNVDGSDAVDNSTNGVRSTVSQEAVQEFQLITNGYAAEYGRASGGVVNIVTRGGTNQLHGTLFGYLRNRNIQAVNPFSTVSNPAYTRVQTGATLSGPLKKDRTFFFLSFETTRRHETGFSSIGQNNFGLVPLALPGLGTFQVTPAQASFIGSNAAILANPADPRYPLLSSYLFLAGASSAVAVNGKQPAAFGGRAGFPTTCTPTTPVCLPMPTSYAPLGSLTGNFPVFEGTTQYSLRLDHRLTDHHQLMLRGAASPSTVTGIQVNAQGPTENFGQNAYSRTSQQTYRDASIAAQEIWTIGNNKLNEFRFQFARRGLLYNFSQGPGGSNVGVNIPGYAFLGREPFSYVNRTEKRWQFTDNFSWTKGNHGVKFGVDVNYLPLAADFTVNFGGVYNFGELTAPSLNAAFANQINGKSFPSFTAMQAYGLGVPQVFIQGIGNPHDAFSNKTFGGFIQDSWRVFPSFTLNYGVRYDIEFTPTFPAANSISDAAEKALGIIQGIPRDSNNVAPRVGFAWDPGKNGKTVVRGSFGMFYDHPLLGLAFDSDVADGTQAPQFAFTGGSPQPCDTKTAGISGLNATNIFQGLLGCLPSSFGYLPNEQRFQAINPQSVFVNQNYLTAGVPLNILPFGFPTSRNFVYAYSEQSSLGIERDLGHNFALGVTYNYNGGHHLNRPIDANAPVYNALIANWKAAMADTTVPAATKAGYATNPLLVSTAGVSALGPYVPAAVTNFFRRSGVNPALCGASTNGQTCAALGAQLNALVVAVEQKYGLGLGVPVPFGGMTPNASNGSSVYHGLTTNLRKRFSSHYELLASYTWSHTIDDSTDLQSPLSPQDNFNPKAERSNSLFDQRHRFVFSGVYQSGNVAGGSFKSHLLSGWTLAPIIEASSGRPFAILVGADTNFDFGSNTDRPNAVPANTPTDSCGNPVIASKYSPTGYLQAPCFIDGTVPGTLRRNAGIRPNTLFTDMRLGREIKLGERFRLNAIMDVFNFINRFNVADVNPLYTQAGTPTASFDPRQFQFALKLNW